MSRTGNAIIKIPEKVKVNLTGKDFLVEGPLGKERVTLHAWTDAEIKDGHIHVKRSKETKDARSIHGMIRAILANAVNGVSTGFKKELQINGVGYRAQVAGKKLKLTLGYSHEVNYDIPEGIKIAVQDQTAITVTGHDKELVGRTAAEIRKYRMPEPYKGKGIKYNDEVIIRKVGKAAGGK